MCHAILLSPSITSAKHLFLTAHTFAPPSLPIPDVLYTMTYTTPSKVSRIIDRRRQGQSQEEIAKSIGIHCTTISQILKQYKQSGDVYHVNPKTGCPCKMEIQECQIAAWMLSRVEAANATEVQKKAFPDVSAHTIHRCLKEQGLLCHV